MLRTLIYSEVLRTWFCFSRYRFAFTDLEFSKIFGNSIFVKKLKNVVTPFCLERNSEQSCVFFQKFGNFRKFSNFLKTHSIVQNSFLNRMALRRFLIFLQL